MSAFIIRYDSVALYAPMCLTVHPLFKPRLRFVKIFPNVYVISAGDNTHRLYAESTFTLSTPSFLLIFTVVHLKNEICVI